MDHNGPRHAMPRHVPYHGTPRRAATCRARPSRTCEDMPCHMPYACHMQHAICHIRQTPGIDLSRGTEQSVKVCMCAHVQTHVLFSTQHNTMTVALCKYSEFEVQMKDANAGTPTNHRMPYEPTHSSLNPLCLRPIAPPHSGTHF